MTTRNLQHQSVTTQVDGLMSDSSLLEQEATTNKRTRCIRLLVTFALVIAVTFVIVDSFGDRKIEAFILNFLVWVEQNPFEGVLAVIGVYIVATVLFIPGSILTLGAGYAFGSASNNIAYGVLLASTVCDCCGLYP